MKCAPRVLWDYAELGRISNLPTCVSNVLVGCAIGAAGQTFPWSSAPWIAAAVCLFYVAGMALNDAVDVEIDRRERPERPIPSGRIRLREAYGLVGLAFAAGLAVLSLLGPAALATGLALVAVIILYDLLHKRFAASVMLMGSTRGLVYLVAAVAVGWPLAVRPALLLAGTLTLYTIAITVVARSENQQQLDARRWISVAMPVVVLAVAWQVRPAEWLLAILGGVALAAWLARAGAAVFQSPPNTKAAVLTWISGMCLVDTYFLALLARPAAAAVALGCFSLTVYAHRRVMGT